MDIFYIDIIDFLNDHSKIIIKGEDLSPPLQAGRLSQ